MKATRTTALVIVSVLLRSGAGQTQVTQLTFESVAPTGKLGCAWSPDGDWIAYSRGAVYGQYAAYGLHRVSPAGGPQEALGPMDSGPQWSSVYSADAQSIFFLKQDPLAIVGGFPSRMPASGGPWQVLGTRTCPAMFSVSRNGNEILYSFGYLNRGSLGLGLIQPARGADLTLFPAQSWTFYRVQVSPTGTMAGFHDPWGICVVGLFGTLYPHVPPGGIIWRWRWGPSGELMSFNRDNLYVLDLRDSSLRSLTDHPGQDSYWSPCGQYIALDRQFFGWATDFVVVEVSSGHVQRLLSRVPPTMLDFTWSPFRDEIAFLDASSVTGQPEVFKMSTGLSPIPAVVGTMVPGTTTTVRIRSAADANRPYLIGAALGREQGISTPRGQIPLDPDPLLAASLAGIPPFRGFQGILDANGRVDAFIDIPPVSALEGLRIFIGYVTLDAAQPSGIGTISGSVPVFVQPPW